MPAPFEQPTKWTRLPAILNDAASVFGRVSVVQMAKESSANERAEGTAISCDAGERAKDFFDGQRHANDTRGADRDFFRAATEMASRFFDSSSGDGVPGCTGGAVGVARIDDDRAHASFRRLQMRLGDQHGRGNNKILREDGRGGCRHITGNQGEVESAGFFQSAGSRGKTETARQGCFGRELASWAEDPRGERESHGRDLRSSA